MKKLILGTIVASSIFSILSTASFAESDSDYEVVYNDCYNLADSQTEQNDDYENWNSILNNCLKEKGFDPESNYENNEGDN